MNEFGVIVFSLRHSFASQTPTEDDDNALVPRELLFVHIHAEKMNEKKANRLFCGRWCWIVR